MQFQKKDLNAIEISAHTLKGLCTIFFAQDLKDLSFKIEKNAKNDTNMDDIDIPITRVSWEN
jgi:HPt (histidine-containing phosphotransfer) domain-containing protein